MSNLKAIKRETTSSGSNNKLRSEGLIPAILYGGKDANQNISVEKKDIKNLVNSDTFLSKVLELDIDGKKEKVIPRDVSFNVVSEEPIHIDFMRIVAGKKIILEIPVKFINHPDSPGLKRGGVLNIVRRSVELKCPAENIPNDITIDLAGTDIGTSLKISSVKLPESVVPTIMDRDFVIATVAAPTIIKEPEKPAEETTEGAEGEAPAEGVEATAKDADPAKKDEKGKEAAAGDKKSDDKKPAEKKPPEKK
jgi:large subunit ribosomal protein L25